MTILDIILEKTNLDYVYDTFYNPDSIVIFEFYNDECSVCPFQKRILEEILQENSIHLDVYTLDIDDVNNLEFVKSFKPTILPSLLIIKEDRLIFMSGLAFKDKIKYFLSNSLQCNSCENLNKEKFIKDIENTYFFCKKHEVYLTI